MEAVRIGSFHARYRLAPSEAATRERLDRLLADMLDERLEHAVAAAGVDTSEEICVRRIETTLHVRLASGDGALADQWGRAVAAAIRAAIRRDGPDVVRYGSRRHALLDAVLSVARGQGGRAWAWRRLGLWPAGEPASREELAAVVLAQLAAEPAAVVPVLAAAAREDAGAVGRLLAAADAPRCRLLAQAALAAAGIPADAFAETALWFSNTRFAARDAAGGLGGEVEEVLVTGAALADAAAQALALAGFGTAPPDVQGPEHPAVTAATAFGVLVALAEDPAPRGRSAFAARAGAIAARLQGPPEHDGRTGDRPAHQGDGARPEAAVAPTELGGDRRHEPAPAEAADAPTAHERRAWQEAEQDDDAPLPERPSGRTRAGGLLCLLNVVDELGLVEELPEERPLQWSLHRLALLLAPVERDDPAALAFCGLAPGVEPPDERAAPSEPAEDVALDTAAARVVVRVADLLDAEDPAEALAAVVLRPAEIVADPGWLDVRLSLDDVSTDLRRAGLDLDPGWLPWLGCVVRFVYV